MDKCVFKPIKMAWNKMFDFNRDNPGKILPNDEFSLKLKNAWDKNFKSDLLLSGFWCTGIFSKFPEEAYDCTKLERFKQANNNGKSQPEPPKEADESLQPGSSKNNNSDLESFIRKKLNENLTKKSTIKQRKRISEQTGDILTSKRALMVLKKKTEETNSKSRCASKGKNR